MSGNAMDAGHGAFWIRGNPDGTFTGDCECGHSYADYITAVDLWDDMEQHREEAGA